MKSEPVLFHELHGQLFAHEILIKSIQDSSIANIVQKAPSSTIDTKQSHPSSNYNKFSQSKRKGPCQICGYRNHTADHCRKRYTPRQLAPAQVHITCVNPRMGMIAPHYNPTFYQGAQYLP